MPRCPIKGFQGTSLIDYPGRIASILFTGGCNFRCRFCHNRALITMSALPDLDLDMVFGALKTRKRFIEGVVVTGGEPTLHPSLIDLLYAIKRIGLDVKLDTNGTHPEILEWVIEDELAEYIAMDYKAPLDKLEHVACIRGAEKRVQASAQLIIQRAPRYEFRTTVHPLLLDLDDIETITRELRGATTYYLQQFHANDALDPELAVHPAYGPEFFHTAAARIRKQFDVFGVRNLAESSAAISPVEPHQEPGSTAFHSAPSPPDNGVH